MQITRNKISGISVLQQHNNWYLLIIVLALFGACSQNKEESQSYQSFHPGALWLDTDSVHINAHGGGIIYHNETYYWFGEHKTKGRGGNTALVGVRCYSSKDLYNWKNEGVALSVSNDAGVCARNSSPVSG